MPLPPWIQTALPWLIAFAVGVGWLVNYLHKVHELGDLREKLRRSDLEREKLRLEVEQMRFKPESLPARRAVYDNLRKVVSDITRDATATSEHLQILHRMRHEAEFLFEDTIVQHIREMIENAVKLHVSGDMLNRGLILNPALEQHAEQRHEALLFFAHEYENLVTLFKTSLRQ